MIRVTDIYEEGCFRGRLARTKSHTYSYISVCAHVYVLVYACPVL